MIKGLGYLTCGKRQRKLGLFRSYLLLHTNRVITCCGGVNKMEPDFIVLSSDRIRGDGHKLKYKKFLLNIRTLVAAVVKQ